MGVSSAATSDGGAGSCSWDPADVGSSVSRDHGGRAADHGRRHQYRGPNTRVINGNIGRILSEGRASPQLGRARMRWK